MNTPAHAIANFLILGRKRKPQNHLPIIFGAILPDLPMVVFYAYEKLVRGMSEGFIWSQSYYNQNWQALFDVFNSVPLIVLGGLLAYCFGAKQLSVLFASMALHACGDLPLHSDDAHRHFFPFSDWRFHSRVSYWDPRHYGNIVAPIEILAVLVGCFIIWKQHSSISTRTLIAIVMAVYVAYGIYVVLVWG